MLANDLLVILDGFSTRSQTVIGICLKPLFPRGKARADGAIDEGLNCGRGGSKLIGREDLAVWVSQVHKMGMDLIEYPRRCTTWHRCIESKFVPVVRHPILNIVNQPKATCNFISRDCANVGVTILVKLDAKELLKEILIWAGFEWWTNALPRKDR